MKNVTLSADEHLIEKARLVAGAEKRTLNDAFREWLVEYTNRSGTGAAVDAVYERLIQVRSGRRFTRDEMNERRREH